MNHLAEILWGLVGAIFGAGAYYARTEARIGRMQSDLNGIGAGRRRFEKNITLGLMVMTEDKGDREMMARYLKDL
jgi:hypothetical protein